MTVIDVTLLPASHRLNEYSRDAGSEAERKLLGKSCGRKSIRTLNDHYGCIALCTGGEDL